MASFKVNEETNMKEFTKYRRTQIAEGRPWYPDDDMKGISVSEADTSNGSPQLGDMIFRNPADHTDRWLVAKKYFETNFEPVP